MVTFGLVGAALCLEFVFCLRCWYLSGLDPGCYTEKAPNAWPILGVAGLVLPSSFWCVTSSCYMEKATKAPPRTQYNTEDLLSTLTRLPAQITDPAPSGT